MVVVVDADDDDDCLCGCARVYVCSVCVFGVVDPEEKGKVYKSRLVSARLDSCSN
jgi:hypothetical protein